MRVGYIYDDIYLKHVTGSVHPESPERLKAINSAITDIESKLIIRKPVNVNERTLSLIHSEAQITLVKEASKRQSAIDSDTICSSDSYNAATMAVGAGLRALQGMKEGEFERAFCAVRPPGHHATPSNSMGFCLFNNIAITAKYAQTMGYEKVMIIDFDVHHGNGTQDAFWEDSSVFYFSTHQNYAYPGSGKSSERGGEQALGFTANFPLMPGSGDDVLLEIYKNELPALVSAFNPDIILVSAGYDLHVSDPLAQLNISTDAIREMVRLILDLANVPYLFLLEGGYDTKALGTNVKVTLEEMLREVTPT